MATRQFFNQALGLEPAPVRLFAKVTIGAAGAPTLVSASSKGVASIARNSAGDYTLTLGDSYTKLFSIRCTVQNSTGIPAAPTMGIKAQSVNTTGAGTVEVVFAGPTNSSTTTLVATDPASGDTLWFELILSNSNL